MLLDHKEILAPDQGDPLHEVLSELGERPSVHALMGEAIGEPQHTHFELTSVLCLFHRIIENSFPLLVETLD